MNEKLRIILLAIGNIIFFIGVLIINALANVLPIGGNTTGQVADSFSNLFAPAGITFSIWGIIYILLLFFSVYQAITIFKKETKIDPYIKKISVFFIFSCLFNMIWIFAWHYKQILLSFFIMIFLLLSLILIYVRLRKGINIRDINIKDKIFIFIPFSIYLGWITVATIANASVLLVKYNWNRFGFSESIWTIIVLAAATIIGILILVWKKDIFYNLVLIWAFAGIIIKRVSIEPLYYEIIITAIISILVLIIFIVFNILKQLNISRSFNP